MKSNIQFLIIICCTLLFFNCFAEEKKETKLKNNSIVNKKVEFERQKLKNAAFCSCLAASLPKTDSTIIKDGSAAGYFETSEYSLLAFESIDSIANVFAQKAYTSKHSKPLNIMKCLDFYNSIELEKLIQSLDNELK
jgi:hypothetical protein